MAKGYAAEAAAALEVIGITAEGYAKRSDCELFSWSLLFCGKKKVSASTVKS